MGDEIGMARGCVNVDALGAECPTCVRIREMVAASLSAPIDVGRSPAAREVEALRKRVAELESALTKIDAIRNSIIEHQSVNWSRDIYPLVAALGEVGYKGISWEDRRKARAGATEGGCQ